MQPPVKDRGNHSRKHLCLLHWWCPKPWMFCASWHSQTAVVQPRWWTWLCENLPLLELQKMEKEGKYGWKMSKGAPKGDGVLLILVVDEQELNTRRRIYRARIIFFSSFFWLNNSTRVLIKGENEPHLAPSAASLLQTLMAMIDASKAIYG